MVLSRIFIKDLAIDCIIGVGRKERERRQKLLISVILRVNNIGISSKTDSLSGTVDYSFLRNEIITFVKTSKLHLLEALANGIADVCLKNKRVEKVHVIVEKPNKYKDTKSVGVEMEKTRE